MPNGSNDRLGESKKEAKMSVDGCLDLLKGVCRISGREQSSTGGHEPAASGGPSTATNERDFAKGVVVSREGKKKGQHIMISYSHKRSSPVKKLLNVMKSARLKTWVDFENITPGPLYNSLAAAIENASLIVVCYSFDYNRSPNCRMEAEYAAVKRKPILYVKTEKFEPDAWLGFMMGQQLHYDITKEEKFQETCKQLIDHIRSMEEKEEKNDTHEEIVEDRVQQIHVQQQQSGHHIPNRGMDELDSPQKEGLWVKWSVDDVQKWLNKNELGFLQNRYPCYAFSF